jgi:hypothetical protein
MASELDQIATLKEIAERFLLRILQGGARAHFLQEFLRGTIRRPELESLFQVDPEDLSDFGAERIRIGQQLESGA